MKEVSFSDYSININQFINYNTKHMDNQSSSSDEDHELEIVSSQTKKPTNRNKFTHKNLQVSSEFPGGNLKAASFQQQFRMEGKIALVIQFWGNSDAQSDPLDKSWFYFSVSGIKEIKQMNYEEIIFRFKNANNLRKFIRQKKFKPYILVRQQSQPEKMQNWKSINISKINILQNQIIEAEFVYSVKQGVNTAYFAQNLPYNLSNLNLLHQDLAKYFQNDHTNKVYYHREVIAQSVDELPVYMCTISSSTNVLSMDQKQPQIWPYKGERPFLLKNKPEIVLTSRVHPSETASSYCIQGVIQSLIKNPNFEFFLHAFIFRIFPMINPDGVQNGHYRLDNYLQNLNRYYGHSDPVKTPSIFSIQMLLHSLREKSKLFLFIDMHGHNSPKPSFIFGNFCQNFYQTIQNKTFVKVLQVLCEGNFDALGCEFSKKHMTVKQKYDEHSKQASARVFAYRGFSQQDNNQVQNKCCQFVEHSYTLQIHPYIILDPNSRKSLLKRQSKQFTNSYKNLPKNSQKKVQQTNPNAQISGVQISQQYKKIGQNTLICIQQILGINITTNQPNKSIQNEDSQAIRKKVFKDISKLVQFYERSKKSRSKQINRQILERYYQKWNIFQTYRSFISSTTACGQVKQKLKQTPIQYIYEEWAIRREKIDQANAKRMRIIKEKEKNIEQSLTSSNNGKMENLQNQQQKEKQQKQLNEQQGSERFTKVVNNPRRNTNQLEAIKNGKVLKSVQFEMIQKQQLRQMKHQSLNKNGQKKSVNSQISDIESLERKIRKLMFRHKTENQIIDYDVYEDTANMMPIGVYALDYKQQQIEVARNGRRPTKQKQHLNHNRLEPLSKNKKTKIIHLKTEQQKRNNILLQFNDKLIVDRIQKYENRGIASQSKKLNTLQGLQPRIQEFVKKLSNNKYQLNLMHGQKHSHQQQCLQIKASNMSNLSISKRKKSLTRVSNEREKQRQKERYVIIKSDESTKRQANIMQSNILEEYIYQAALNQQVVNNNSQENSSILRQRISGYHNSVKNKLKNTNILRKEDNFQQVNNIVRSYRVLAAQNGPNKLQFINDKAKKILSEKRRETKAVQQPIFPSIPEFDSLNGFQKKSKQ